MDSKVVWSAMFKSSTFAGLDPLIQEAHRPFIERAPRLLGPWLGAVLTFDLLIRAKNVYITHCVGFELVKAVLESLSTKYTLGKEVRAHFEHSLEEISDTVASMWANPAQFVKFLDVSETEAIILMFGNGLPAEELRAYLEAGGKTLGDLLATYPSVVLDFIDDYV